jgi:protein-S-isoprenylcysteine O-methyltransferase Ste14
MRAFDLVFLAGFGVYVALRGHFQNRVVGEAVVAHRHSARDRVLLVFVAIGCVFLPVLYLATPCLDFAAYTTPAPVSWSGGVVMVAAVWLFWRSHADLGRQWSVTLELRDQHQLITHGVYARVRHPMYAAIWLFSLAQALLLANWLAGWSAIVAFGTLYFARVGNEERMLADHFGDAWRAYCSRTGRLVPRFGAR